MRKPTRTQPLVIFMLAAITQFFGNFAQGAAPAKVFTRQVDLSGNIFQFSLPENFSKDMPAEPMAEKLDINALKKFDNPEYGNIVRRWWDIKKPGFFGKQLGTVMMDISVQRTPQNTRKILHDHAFDTTLRLDFLSMIYEQFYQRYEPLNKEAELNENGMPPYHYGFCSIWGDRVESSIRDRVYNGQKWFSNGTTAPHDQIIILLATPLTDKVHLEVSITYAVNDHIISGEFMDYAEDFTKSIEQTFNIHFASDNPMRQLVEHDWIESTNDDFFEANRQTLLPALFGPNIFQEIEEGLEQARKLDMEIKANGGLLPQ